MVWDQECSQGKGKWGSCMALPDNGMQINTIMLGLIENHSLDIGPLSDPIVGWVTCVGLGNTFTWLMGYVVIQVQVNGDQGYDKDQIALVILDLSSFVAQVPVILGTSTISHVMKVIKENEIGALVTPWIDAWVAYLLVVQCATATVEDDKLAIGASDPVKYDEVVTTKETDMIDAFSSHIHAKIWSACTGAGLNMMTQALHAEDGSLPQGLTIQNAYTEMCNSNKNVSIIVRNSMAYPQTLKKRIPVARAVVANWVPELQMWPRMIEALDEAQGIQTLKLTMKQIQEKLFKNLDLSGLESWSPELVNSAQSLLAEYYNIFSLEPSELGCTHSTKHVIKVTDDVPFKERFRQIPLLLVEEVCTHLQEVLDWGAICPSQSAWCNEVVLFWKRDGGLHFCIDFCCLNTHRMKDSYLQPRIQEALDSLVSAGHFSCLDLKSEFWQIKMDEQLKQYTAFTVGNLGFFEHNHMLFGLCNTSANFQRLMQNCLVELNLTYCLIHLDDIVIFSQTDEEHLHHLHVIFYEFREHNLKLKLSKSLSSPLSLKGWGMPKQLEPRSNCRMSSASNLHEGACLSQPGRPLQKVHQRVCTHCTATQWIPHWGRGQQEVRMGVTYRRSHEVFQSIEAGMYDSSHFGSCWLH